MGDDYIVSSDVLIMEYKLYVLTIIFGHCFTCVRFNYILVTPYAENIHNSLHCLFVVYYTF